MKKIFISATTQGLKPFRGIVSEVVAAQNFFPVVQEYFHVPTDAVMNDVRRKIGECHGVIALVGPFYGNESTWTRRGVAMSYTQHELLFALDMTRRPCLVMCTSRHFQPGLGDHGELPVQSEEFARLQRQFVAEIKGRSGFGWTEFSDRFEFALALAKHRWEDWLNGRR